VGIHPFNPSAPLTSRNDGGRARSTRQNISYWRYREQSLPIRNSLGNYWLFDNSVIRSPTRLEQLFRDLVRKSSGAYAKAAVHDNSL